MLDILQREGLIERRQGSGTYALELEPTTLRRAVLLVDTALKLGDDPFFSRVVEKVQAGLQAGGTQVVLQRTDGEKLVLPRCDAVLALGNSALSALEEPLVGAQPAVGLFAHRGVRPNRRLSILGLEDADAGAKAANRLLEQGVKRVFFFGRRSVPAVKERVAGAGTVVEAAGIPFQVVECGLNFAAGLEQGIRFIEESDELTGIIAANDWLAMGLRAGLQSRGSDSRLRLPMVSFDALPLTERSELAIDSLAVPLETMVLDAVAELGRLLQPRVVGRAIRYELDWRQNSQDGTV